MTIFFREASQLLNIAKNSQNVQNLGFFWKKICLFEKKLEMFQDRWLWQICLKGVSNGIIAQEFSERSKFWGFHLEKMGFWKRTLNCFISKKLLVTNVSRKRLKWYYCVRILKTFKTCVFFETRWISSNKTLEIYQQRSLWHFFLKSVSNGITAEEFWKR